MIAMDATRLPRGMKFEVKPGKAILTNGAPSEILYPFKFGQSDPNNLATAKEFERMLLQATGTLDSQGLDIFRYNSKSYGAEDYLSLSKEILKLK